MTNPLKYHFIGHIFEISAIDLLLQYQAEINSIPSLTFTFPQTRLGIGSTLKSIFPHANVFPISNKGRDFYPFQQAIRKIDVLSNDLVIKWHDKRRNHFSGLPLTMVERKNLLEYCLPYSGHELPPLLLPFQNNNNISLSTIKGWLIPLSLRLGNNRKYLMQFCQRDGLQWEDVLTNAFFPAGGVFAAKIDLLQNSNWAQMDDLEIEYGHGGLDGTWAHASERWVGVLASRSGQFSEVTFK